MHYLENKCLHQDAMLPLLPVISFALSPRKWLLALAAKQLGRNRSAGFPASTFFPRTKILFWGLHKTIKNSWLFNSISAYKMVLVSETSWGLMFLYNCSYKEKWLYTGRQYFSCLGSHIRLPVAHFNVLPFCKLRKCLTPPQIWRTQEFQDTSIKVSCKLLLVTRIYKHQYFLRTMLFWNIFFVH